MLKLYGQYRSRAFRVAWLCKESNIPYEHVNITTNIEAKDEMADGVTTYLWVLLERMAPSK